MVYILADNSAVISPAGREWKANNMFLLFECVSGLLETVEGNPKWCIHPAWDLNLGLHSCEQQVQELN